MSYFTSSLYARFGALAVVAIGVFVGVLLYTAEPGIGIRIAYFIGVMSPGVLIGLIVGWLTLNREAWVLSTILGVAACLVVYGFFR